MCDNDFICSGNGSDTVDGGDGNDFIFGANGNDLLYGANGDDTLAPGAERTRLNGGLGRDTFVLNFGDQLPATGQERIIEDFEFGNDILQITDAPNIRQFSNLTFNQVGSNTFISAGSTIVAELLNTQASQLTARDFFFGSNVVSNAVIDTVQVSGVASTNPVVLSTNNNTNLPISGLSDLGGNSLPSGSGIVL